MDSNNTKGQESQESGPKVRATRRDNAAQQGTNAPGTAVDQESIQDTRPVASKSGERIIHAKAVRTIAGRHDMSSYTLEFIAALQMFLKIKGREGIGVGEDHFIDWTGARPAWKKRLREARNEAYIKGLIEEIPRATGKAIDISRKGERILQEYDERFNEVMRDIRLRTIAESIEADAKRMMREARRRKEDAKRMSAAA